MIRDFFMGFLMIFLHFYEVNFSAKKRTSDSTSSHFVDGVCSKQTSEKSSFKMQEKSCLQFISISF